MEESFASKHSRELLAQSFEELLDGRVVSYKSPGHFEAFGRYVTDGGFYVIWNPFDKERAVYVLDIEYLFVHFFHGHATTENC